MLYGLVGTAEVAVMLNISRQRVHQLAQRPDFPAPVAILAAGTIWNRADVEEWRAAHRPEPEE